MISLDTNALVRLIVADDVTQAKKALKMIENAGEVFISTVVLCETSWVLTSCYSKSKQELVNIFEKILSTEEFNIENSEAIWLALTHYRNFSLDLSDAIVGAVASQHEALPVMTFDRKAAKAPAFDLIA